MMIFFNFSKNYECSKKEDYENMTEIDDFPKFGQEL